MSTISARSRWFHRGVAAIGLFILPGITIWNLATELGHPGLGIHLGRRLVGVTESPPLEWSFRALVEGNLQTAIAHRVADSIPLRPILIRLSNELRYSVFGIISAPNIVEGNHARLIQDVYLREYCMRGPATGATKAQQLIPKLREIQDYYDARHGVFVYMTTPSKAAYFPEDFTAQSPFCPSTEADRKAMLPVFTESLRAAGITVVDAASLIHERKGNEGIELFPHRGVHWNELAAAYATQALIHEINNRAGRQLFAPINWRYRIIDHEQGSDSDLDGVLNNLIRRTSFLAPEVTFAPSVPCEGTKAATLDVALVGSSFLDQIYPVLGTAGCASGLGYYGYLRTVRSYGRTSAELTPTDIALIRNADVVVVEENESFLGQTGYVGDLVRLLTGR